MTEDCELLVVGSGIAGLTAAVRAAERGIRVGVVTKGTIDQTATGWAQGGVAAVLGQVLDDSVALHVDDTLRAGAGLCDEDAVAVLVNEGPVRVRELIDLGAQFDRDPDGTLQLAREGGHTYARVVHAGGAATGAEIERALVEAVGRSAVAVEEHAIAVELIVGDGRCRGVRVLQGGQSRDVLADHVLLATGGAGQLFALTTNPLEATGDGLAMALRAGVAVADVEFMQFHPTALAVDRLPRPLLSEALRGDGALLRDRHGKRFVDELQPRDIVARAITARMLEAGEDHVWLDVTPIHDFAVHFPTIARVLGDAGLDPARDWLPVALAAHYLCGGVIADLDGATTVPHLWAAGEVSCSGVHGANRLASNSLLDGLVFGARVVDALTKGKSAPDATGTMRCVLEPGGAWRGRPISIPATPPAPDHTPVTRAALQRAMTDGAGVLRDAGSLATVAHVVAGATDAPDAETRNLATVATALVGAARAREESRGAHARTDFPDRDDARWLARAVIRTGV
jgi:L-aspartate oxidase